LIKYIRKNWKISGNEGNLIHSKFKDVPKDGQYYNDGFLLHWYWQEYSVVGKKRMETKFARQRFIQSMLYSNEEETRRLFNFKVLWLHLWQKTYKLGKMIKRSH